MSGAKRKCSNDQITSAQPTSPSASSPTLHPHPSLEARARPCSAEAQQLVSHDVDAKLRPPIIQLIHGSLQPYIAKMGNMEPQHIARLVSSDVSAKLKPLIDGLAIQCVESYMNLGANSSVWAPNPSMDNARIVSELVQLPGGELLVLCEDHPRVGPHLQQTLADCTPFKVKIANSSQMPQKVFAGENLKNSDGSPIEVEMINNRTGSIVLEGLESSAQVTVVVLEGSGENWIEVKPRDGKPPLLAGCVTATLKEGKGRFDNLQITDNSSFVREKKFRLGFKTQLDSGIQGAFSEAICVKDARGKSNVKKEIPEEDDPVDVLVNIAKDGARSRKLNDNGIKTVKQLVLSYEKDPKGLQNMFEHMAKKSFDATIENAKRSQPVQMAQNQTTISGGAKEGHAVISVQKDVSGLLMSGDHSKFNVLENQHNLSLGHPQGDHLNPLAGLAMSSHSGEPGVVLQSLAFQPRVDTDCLNETAFPIDEMLLDSGTFFDPSWPSWGAVDFSAGSN
ncbi:hypothetical protein BDL97_11G033700 [Sphagnum fallax]|nr:hypothetical protein BDL97_11G033700 [Sphagnum fallax]